MAYPTTIIRMITRVELTYLPQLSQKGVVGETESRQKSYTIEHIIAIEKNKNMPSNKNSVNSKWPPSMGDVTTQVTNSCTPPIRILTKPQ